MSKGGRGGKRAGPKMIEVTMPSGVKLSYQKHGNKVYSVDPNTTTSNVKEVPLSMNQIIERAEQMGASVKRYNQKQFDNFTKKYEKERAASAKQLANLWFKDGPRPRKGWKGH